MLLPPLARRFIERHRVARLATVDEDGAPHLVPVCFALEEDTLYSVVDEKPKRTTRLQRLRNIDVNPTVALLFDDYSEDWDRLAWVMVRGRASVIEDGGEHAVALAALRARYPQYAGMALEGRPVICVTPEVVRHWGLREDIVAASASEEVAGLNLVRTVDRIAAAHVTTEYRAGVSTGQVSRLRRVADGAHRDPIEPSDEAAMPDEGGRMMRYPLADLDDGIYVAESVGAANASRHTYFEVFAGRVGRLFDGERRALQELRRRER